MLYLLLLPVTAQAQDLGLSPTRPTIANSATIQNKGVLQVEPGYDAYPGNPPGNQQTLAAAFFYAPYSRLRLDLAWSSFAHEQDASGTTNGVGTITIGGKIPFYKESFGHSWPGVGLQYEAELPTASVHPFQNLGQQAILLVNKHIFGVDFIGNGSIVQADCQAPTGCSYGGQQSLAISYHLNKVTRLYAEAFGQNTSSSNTPPGTYIFSGFYHQFSDSFGVDGGLRFGVSDHSSSFGTTVGVVLGKRLRPGPATVPPKP